MGPFFVLKNDLKQTFLLPKSKDKNINLRVLRKDHVNFLMVDQIRYRQDILSISDLVHHQKIYVILSKNTKINIFLSLLLGNKNVCFRSFLRTKNGSCLLKVLT